MIRSRACEESTENFCSWKMSLKMSFLIFVHSHPVSEVKTSTLLSKPAVPTPSCSSSTLLYRPSIPSLSCTEYFTFLFPSKTLSCNPSFYNYCSFFLLIFSNKLFERTDYSHHLSFLSPINNLACLPSIPPKLLSVNFGNLLIAQCIFQTLSS